jgi:hypothetical protein
MRLGSRNKRQGNRRNRQMFFEAPGVEPTVRLKARMRPWGEFVANFQWNAAGRYQDLRVTPTEISQSSNTSRQRRKSS